MYTRLGRYDRISTVSTRTRIMTGVILVVIICSFLLAGELPFMFLILCISQLALMEYERLVQIHRLQLQNISIHILALIATVFTYLIGKLAVELSILLLLTALIPLILSIELFRKKKNPIENVALSILGFIWISVPLCLFLLIAYLPFGSGRYEPAIVLGYFFILWLSDSGAYFIGKTIGKRKLFQRISPKKTWEGFSGGLLLAWFAGFVNSFLFHQLQLGPWLLLSLIIYITGTFGDFAKSMLKRSVSVKDSGNLLPGHGGILDRFDTLIGSAPFAFLYLLFYA